MFKRQTQVSQCQAVSHLDDDGGDGVVIKQREGQQLVTPHTPERKPINQ